MASATPPRPPGLDANNALGADPSGYDEEQADYPVQPSIVSVSDLGGENLDQHHAVVLANVADVPLGFADRLASYVEAGGGLIIFAGGNLRPESYNTLLHRKHGLLPITFSPDG